MIDAFSSADAALIGLGVGLVAGGLLAGAAGVVVNWWALRKVERAMRRGKR